jgi:hypothetical protein
MAGDDEAIDVATVYGLSDVYVSACITVTWYLHEIMTAAYRRRKA